MLHLSLKGTLCKQVSQKGKKLVLVSAISMSMTEKTDELERISCIQYPVTFKDQTKSLLDSGSEVNTMSQAFV